jgi:hypothetical protein
VRVVSAYLRDTLLPNLLRHAGLCAGPFGQCLHVEGFVVINAQVHVLRRCLDLQLQAVDLEIDELALLEADANALVAVLVRIGFELIEVNRHVQFLALAMAKWLNRADIDDLDPVAFEAAWLMDVAVEDPLGPELREGLGGDQVWAVAIEVPVAEMDGRPRSFPANPTLSLPDACPTSGTL